MVARSGERFTVSCSQPRAQQRRHIRSSKLASVSELLDRRRELTSVNQYERLLPDRMHKLRPRSRFSGCDLGNLMVIPGLAQGATVERLPAGQSGRIRKNNSEGLSVLSIPWNRGDGVMPLRW